ncbi:hypothetical protein OROMI_006890 [Orobanche minor]
MWLLLLISASTMNMRILSRNELSGSGIGVGVSIDPYASDTIVLHNLIQDIYKNITTKPTVITPGGIFDRGWFQQYLAKTVRSLNVLSHHIYNLGPGNDEHLIDRILNTSILDKGADVFRNLHDVYWLLIGPVVDPMGVSIG